MNLSDITFVTHIRLDSEDRIKNFQTVLNYYSQNLPGCKFIIVEDASEHDKRIDQITWPPNTSFYLIKNKSWYYRTRALNYGKKQAKTKIVATLDTDCIVPIDSIKRCVKALMSGATMARPYNGYVINISNTYHQEFVDSGYSYSTLFNKLGTRLKPKLLEVLDDGNMQVQHNASVGGVVMFNKERFFEVGGYNEKFIAWGYEDNEIKKRVITMDHGEYIDTMDDSICFHLHHRNTIKNQHPYYNSNQQEAHKISVMNKKELTKYIDSELKNKY